MIENWSEMVGKWVVDSLGRMYRVAAVNTKPSVLLETEDRAPQQFGQALIGTQNSITRAYQLGFDTVLLQDLRPYEVAGYAVTGQAKVKGA